MVNNINNFGTINFFESNSPQNKKENVCEDITPCENSSSAATNESQIPDSIIFTKKAKKEGKQAEIIHALKQSVNGRNDKTRAFVDELKEWQKENYIDQHYNARVMYDELEKLTPLAFSYDTFRKYYNNLM